MPPKIQKTKEQKLKAAMSSSKAKKKKWSKGKVRDKLNNCVLFEQAAYDSLLKQIPTGKLVTPSVISERFKCRGSLARRAIKDLVQRELIKPVVVHGSQLVYTRVTHEAAAAE